MTTRARLTLIIAGVLLSCAAFLAEANLNFTDRDLPDSSATQIGKLQWPHVYDISPEEKVRQNPVRCTELSVARGRKTFLSQCAVCHGVKADGQGDLARELKMTPADFTNPATLKNRTDGEVFAIMSHGSESMPGQGTRLEDMQKWNLINYLRAMSGRTPEKSDYMVPEEKMVIRHTDRK